MCHSRQASHYHAKRHPAGQKNKGERRHPREKTKEEGKNKIFDQLERSEESDGTKIKIVPGRDPYEGLK